jgi:hypothetical protein
MRRLSRWDSSSCGQLFPPSSKETKSLGESNTKLSHPRASPSRPVLANSNQPEAQSCSISRSPSRGAACGNRVWLRLWLLLAEERRGGHRRHHRRPAGHRSSNGGDHGRCCLLNGLRIRRMQASEEASSDPSVGCRRARSRSVRRRRWGIYLTLVKL